MFSPPLPGGPPPVEAANSTATQPITKGMCVHCTMPVLGTHKRLKCDAGYLHQECGSLIKNLTETGDIKDHNKVLRSMHTRIRALEGELSQAKLDSRLASQADESDSAQQMHMEVLEGKLQQVLQMLSVPQTSFSAEVAAIDSQSHGDS